MADVKDSDQFNFSDSINITRNVFNLSCNASYNDTCREFPLTSDVEPDKVFWALLLIPLPLVAVFGNILVILSVYKEKSLQSVTNYFIVSLAFADLLVAAVVMPFAVYVLVNVDWELSDTLCDFYIAVDVTCSTASIFNLVAISIDRYIAVTKPIKYSKHRNNRRVFLTIVIVWLVSAAIGSPIVLGLNTSPERIPQLCVFYNSDFIIYSSLSSFYIPCIVVVFLYYKIFKAIHERAKKNKKRARSAGNRSGLAPASQPVHQQEAQLGQQLKVVMEADAITVNTGSGSPDDDDDDIETAAATTSQPNVHVVAESVQMNVVVDIEPMKTKRIPENGNTDSGYGASQHETPFCLKNDDVTVESPKVKKTRVSGTTNMAAHVTSQRASQNDTTASPLATKRNGVVAGSTANLEVAKVNGAKKKSRFNLGRRHKSSSKKREKASAKRERKATKTLAIVLGMFLMCWLPFFTCNILDAICIKLENDTWRPGVTLFLLTTWLGYINSCVNPVIYTIFNMEFRKAFKKLLQNMWTCSHNNYR